MSARRAQLGSETYCDVVIVAATSTTANEAIYARLLLLLMPLTQVVQHPLRLDVHNVCIVAHTVHNVCYCIIIYAELGVRISRGLSIVQRLTVDDLSLSIMSNFRPAREA